MHASWRTNQAAQSSVAPQCGQGLTPGVTAPLQTGQFVVRAMETLRAPPAAICGTGIEVVADLHALEFVVGNVDEQRVHDVVGVDDAHLRDVAEDVVGDERRDGDEEAARGGEEHFGDFSGERRGSQMPLPASTAKAPIMPMTVPSRPIMGLTTPMTER